MEIKVRFPNLGFMFQYEDIAVSVFGWKITIYGLLIAAGMLLGILFITLQAKRQKQNPNLYLGAAVTAIVGGLIGARIYYIVFSWETFSGESWKVLCDIRNGGMAIYGGILGGALIVALYCCICRISFGRIADSLSIGLLITQIIGVWGNFFNRSSFGEYTESLFAMRLPLESVQSSAVTEEMMDHLVEIGGIEYIQVHPLFFYESIWCILLLVVLLIYTSKKKFHGEIFLRYLAGYGLGKCVIEWLRTDRLTIPNTEIPISLIVSAVLFVFCGIMATVRRILWKQRAEIKRRKKDAKETVEESNEETAEESIGEATEEIQEDIEEMPEETSETSKEISDETDETDEVKEETTE